MKNSLFQRAAQFYQNRRRKQLWYRVVSGMACVVVFCTVYALILPAITLEKESACGLEEHTHTEECYITKTVWPSTKYLCEEELAGAVVVHTHNKKCYDRNGDLACPLPELEEHEHGRECYRETKVLTCEQEETGHIHDKTCYTRVRGELICGAEACEGHAHGSGCYETEQALVCTQEEGEDHTHDDGCYETRKDLTCELEESEGHAHTDDCYQWTEMLSCGREEDLEGHIHSADCYTTVTELICDEEEITLHTHDEDCFDEDGNLICGKVQVLAHRHDETCAVEPEGEPEEVRVLICGKEEHTHTDLCYEPQKPATEDGVYICGLEEHTHDETCYDESGELTCGLEEHVHDESCVAPPEVPSYICGKEEHTHGETCYDESGELICGLEEHVHGETCLALPEVPLRELTYEGADYTVSVSFGEDAALPEGVTLSAEEIAPDSEEYQTYYQQTLDTLTARQREGAEQLLFARFFDVQFLLDGQVLEPAAPVSVTITYDEPVETGEDVSCQAIHFTEDGPELLEAEAEEDPESGATSFTHTQESFSVVGSLVTRPLANATDIGPDSLPVDYYVCIDGRWTRVGATRTGWYAPADASGWTDHNRDYITVEQAKSILGPYGFTGEEENPARKVAYQQKTGDVKLYSDTNTVQIDGKWVIPLARNTSGFNLYYLPANTNSFKSVVSPESLDKAANGFYTVTVSGAGGKKLQSELVLSGGSFTYDAADSGVTNWLVAYDNGTIQTIEGSTIQLRNITSTVHVSPYRGDVGSHSVTFKVLLDGVWQEVGSLPYYYTGIGGDDDRAYITSDMAAQFFGKFGYTAATEPGYQFGYSYNDIYEIYYASGTTKTGYCMDINGNNIAEGEKVQLWTSNHSPAQIFRIWDAGNGYSFITPINDSSLHVNVYQYVSGDIGGKELRLSGATNANSQWKVETYSDGRTTFWSALAPTIQVIDLYNGKTENGTKIQTLESTGGARYWYLEQLYRVSNDTVSRQNDDGTYNIGLTAESNEADRAVGNTILISDGAVIRLVSDTSSGDYYNGTTFYDYNISSGQNADGRWRTGITGINSKENYGTSLNGQRTWNSAADVLAFGNANCGTGMAYYQFDGGTLNKYNDKNSNYGGTTFGLASGLNSDGTIKYNGWIVAPKLFNEGDAQYKQTYAGSSLTFDRVGDTYTLSAATLANSNGRQNTINGLQYFFNPSPYGGKTHTHIYTNNFWPMDQAAGRTDALWGAYGNPGKFQGFVEGGNPTSGWSANAADFPVGDDGCAHNWFFGMNFALSFNLTEDYVGPLEYYFFGDDDLWVFLDNRLVCDIGGVHSSVGEYVNLRDYLPNGSSGQHTLSFFYTERGDTGSTCYMSFTLPSVSSATTERDTGSLKIQKSVAGADGVDLSGVEYRFLVELLNDNGGEALNQTFSYSRSDGTYGTVKSGGTIDLKQAESVTISGLPAGTFYRVTELTTEGYTTTVNGNEGYVVSNKITSGDVAPAAFVNTLKTYELPQTGGTGTHWYTLGGLCLMAGALLLLYRTKTRGKGGREHPC